MTAIEMDRRLVPVLEEVTSGMDVRLVAIDAMTADWPDLLGERAWKLVANLPYNVATPLVLDLLDGAPQVGTMVVLVQREAAERLAAAPGDPGYGIPSVKVAYWATSRVAARVPPTVFYPRPRVESAVVRIDRRPAPATGADAQQLFAVVKAAFGQRRKMLRRSLAGMVDEPAFERAGISPTARPESLGVEDFGRLVEATGASL